MRKPLNITAGLFVLAFVSSVAVAPGSAQAQDPGVITCPDGLIVYSGESCKTYDEESVPQNGGLANAGTQSNQSTTQSATTIESADSAAAGESTSTGTSATTPEAPKTEPQVITKEQEKGVLDYLPRPVQFLIEAAQALAN